MIPILIVCFSDNLKPAYQQEAAPLKFRWRRQCVHQGPENGIRLLATSPTGLVSHGWKRRDLVLCAERVHLSLSDLDLVPTCCPVAGKADQAGPPRLQRRLGPIPRPAAGRS